MAPRKPKRPSPKRIEQDELKSIDAVQIIIRASEANLQRIGALLLFADLADVKLVKPEQPLPWEDPKDPRFQKPAELQLDRRTVENSVVRLLEKYLAEHGREKVVELIASFGAPTLRELNDEQLLGLYNSLAGEAAHE